MGRAINPQRLGHHRGERRALAGQRINGDQLPGRIGRVAPTVLRAFRNPVWMGQLIRQIVGCHLCPLDKENGPGELPGP